MPKPVSRPRRLSREQIAAILDKLDRSELSVLAFARSEGLSVSTLRF